MDRTIIDQYEAGGAELRIAITGLKPDELLAHPVPGTWSIQEIVMHLADSDLILADRMKRVIAEENPSLIGFNETLFAQKLHYSDQSVEDAVTILDLNRRNFARVLRKLPDTAFSRIGTHNERGPLKLSELLTMSVNHVKHHLAFVVSKKEKLGK
jgi:uncharacterized damage-inducible protein DinB